MTIISQSSEAKLLGNGGIFHDDLLQIDSGVSWWNNFEKKLINIWQNYSQQYGGIFFKPTLSNCSVFWATLYKDN